MSEKKTKKTVDLQNIEWGENHQERIIDDSPKHNSARHMCKGPKCVNAFEKS